MLGYACTGSVTAGSTTDPGKEGALVPLTLFRPSRSTGSRHTTPLKGIAVPVPIAFSLGLCTVNDDIS